MNDIMPVHHIINNIKSSVSVQSVSVLINDDLFIHAEESLKKRYADLVITDDKQFSKERAHLRRFAKTLKDFYKSVEDKSLEELRNTLRERIYSLAGLVESLANEIADKENIFIIEKQDQALAKVMEYINSLIGAPYLQSIDQIEIKSFYKNYSGGSFLRAKKDVDEQVERLKSEYERNILEQQQDALQKQQEAKNYEYIVNYIDRVNKQFSLTLDASEFYQLRTLHLADIIKELDKYTEFLKQNNNTVNVEASEPETPATDSDILDLLKAAQYILYSQHGLIVDPLEKAINILIGIKKI